MNANITYRKTLNGAEWQIVEDFLGVALYLNNFGTFEVKKRMERVVVNPGTQQRMLVPPKLVLNFKPIASIKENLKNGGLQDE